MTHRVIGSRQRTAVTYHIARHEDNPAQTQEGYPLRAAVKLMAVSSIVCDTHSRPARAQVVDVVTAGDGVTIHHIPVQQRLSQINLHKYSHKSHRPISFSFKIKDTRFRLRIYRNESSVCSALDTSWWYECWLVFASRARILGENVRQFIPRLHVCLFVCLFVFFFR